ncbi:MAG: type VI secretion system baseplate subunit TssE [Alcanivorax sp.]|nr:type VI secretion system baseplate subunit TssE [Alcanivorax sp.]
MTAALFEVLHGRFADGTPVASLEGREARLRSIHDHLRRLLNARHDALPHLPEYGLPDLPTLYDGLPYSLDALIRLVRDAITRFEPRLQHVQVAARVSETRECVVQLEVTGVVENGELARFRTFLQSDGGAEVRQGVANARVF